MTQVSRNSAKDMLHPYSFLKDSASMSHSVVVPEPGQLGLRNKGQLQSGYCAYGSPQHVCRPIGGLVVMDQREISRSATPLGRSLTSNSIAFLCAQR